MQRYAQTTLSWTLIILTAPALAATEQARPTPTPRPGSLAAYASSHRLSTDQPTTITNQSLEQGADGSSLTTGAPSGDEAEPIPTPTPVDPRARARWQKAYSRQREVIAGLMSERVALEAELDAVRSAQLSARTLIREQEIERKLRRIGERLDRERSALDRIVREARHDGAQPGWFRGL